MKVLILGDVNSVHIQKWCIGLASQGISIGIFSLAEVKFKWFDGIDNVEICGHGAIKDSSTFRKKAFSKIQYLKVVPALKKAIKAFKPDIVHAHYASSYGLLGALAGFHPFYISVWGNDVFGFPNQGTVNRTMLKSNLKKADRILSTSNVMASETSKYTNKNVTVIPFGVDMEIFKPREVESLFNKTDIIIGTIKTLEEKYGIEYLIRAFAILKKSHPDKSLKLLIVGGGSMKDQLQGLTKELHVDSHTVFTGEIGHPEIPNYQNMLDISVSLSIDDSESFGVAVVEAMACGIPVIVSNVGGLPEVVDNEVSGFVVPAKDSEKTAEAMSKLIQNKLLRKTMGINGRNRAEQYYDWQKCVELMLESYKEGLEI